MKDSLLHRKMIINADDFGMSSAVNKAILLAFEEGLISSASLMANMPGFEEACTLIRNHGLNGKIGIHLNLVEGRPLTTPITKCSRFCDDRGLFSKKPIRRAIRLSRDESRAVEEEFRCQIQACMDNCITPTHLDSHHQYHLSWPIGLAVIHVAKEKNVPAVRLNGTYTLNNVSTIRKFYRALYNARLLLSGLAKTQYACTPVSAPAILEKQQGIVEIIVHPRFDETGKLIDWMFKKELKQLLGRLGQQELIPYPS